jgi:replication factor A1
VPSFRDQRLEIRSVPAPVEQQGQARLPAQLEEKTLRQLNEMDPYDFAVSASDLCLNTTLSIPELSPKAYLFVHFVMQEGGYRCTVTIGRLVPNASWWFPSCTRCSKSCVPDGAGYRCNPCSNTSFKFKYALNPQI